MKESSTRAFPNGLIPSPLARHVKIFTHWTSGGWRGVSKESWMDIDNLSYVHVGSSGWYELTSMRLWKAELAIVSPSTWGKNCEKCDKIKYNSWPSCCPHENAKKKQKTDPGVFGAHNFYWVEGELLIVVHLEISQRSSKHSRNKFDSKKDLRVFLGLLPNLQEAHLRIKNANSKFFGQTFWFRTLTPNPPTFRVGWGLPSILLDCSDRNY